VLVSKLPLAFAPAGAENPLDNERADVNGDGVQLYVRDRGVEEERVHAWLLVPDAEPAVRATPLTVDAPSIQARWRPTADGYALHVAGPRRGARERVAGAPRARRRGQRERARTRAAARAARARRRAR
jgi:hypothetical protein